MNYKDSDIFEILPQRYPFLMIDKIKECIPNEKVVCIKNVTANEPHFLGHFPNFPVMPGVLILEAAAQAGIVFFYKNNLVDIGVERDFLLSSVKANYFKPVLPGDQLVLTITPVKLVSEAAILKAECTVDGEIVAKCDFTVSAKIRSIE